MCGFAGFVGGGLSGPGARSVLGRMSEAIIHRGPDDSGIWVDEEAGVGLAHRRLAVLDLSVAGHQPMVSPNGNLVLVFNGEIYNHAELRRQLGLQGRTAWRGHSDTETLINGFEEWGVEKTLSLAVGMFAFALWDTASRVLYLGRDRIGEKPLYYGWQQRPGGAKSFIFASELKALLPHPSFADEISEGAVSAFVRFGNVPGVQSIYRGVEKLLPGCVLSLDARTGASKLDSYWDLGLVATNDRFDAFAVTEAECAQRLEDAIAKSVRQQVLADVPVGAFLSGGVDSALIIALMCRESSRRVRTFSVGFENSLYDEAPYARAVARHLGTEHAEISVTSQMAADLIPRLRQIYDEPFSDSSQIPTFFVSKLARENVTVSLSGDGGDELFGGYNRYLFTARLWPTIRRLSPYIRHAVGSILRVSAPVMPDQLNLLIPKSLRVAGMAEKLQKSAGVLAAESLEDLYLGLLSLSPNAGRMLDRSFPGQASRLPKLRRYTGLSDSELMMIWDMQIFLPDDILVKVDRAAMAVSLESRMPLLDSRVIELALKIPQHMKIRRTTSGYITKWIMRQILYKYVPQELIDRPKKGFAAPIGEWIRSPLRDWAEDRICEKSLREVGVFDIAYVREMFRQHLSGRRDWPHELWRVLMLQDWMLSRTRFDARSAP